jgi:hypothetical protein
MQGEACTASIRGSHASTVLPLNRLRRDRAQVRFASRADGLAREVERLSVMPLDGRCPSRVGIPSETNGVGMLAHTMSDELLTSIDLLEVSSAHLRPLLLRVQPRQVPESL